MAYRIYIFDNKASFVCPKCKKSKTINVKKYKKTKKKVKVNCKCPCGNSFEALLERRSYHRKEITLPGIYSRSLEANGIEKGNIVIMDLSRAGLKFKSHVKAEFRIGDRLSIDFHLNDKEKSFIKREAVIRNISHDSLIGAQFDSSDFYGKIGAYLFD